MNLTYEVRECCNELKSMLRWSFIGLQYMFRLVRQIRDEKTSSNFA